VKFTAEARFGLDFLQRMVERADQDALLPGRHREANNYYVGDHDIWRLPQADDHYLGTKPALRVHPAPTGLPGRPARLADQPQPGRPAGGRLRALLPGVPEHRPGLRQHLPALGRRPCTGWPARTGKGTCLTVVPFRLLRRDLVAAE